MGASFRELVVWRRSIELTRATYQLTKAFPPQERYGLTDQMRRAAVSIASNIAEGHGRSTRGEYRLFLGHARGSTCELETQLVIVRALGYGTFEDLNDAEKLVGDVSRLLGALMRSLDAR